MSDGKHDMETIQAECVDLTIHRFVYSSVAGALFGFLLFRKPANRRAAVALGAGIGIESAYTECFQKFDGLRARSASPSQTPGSQGTQD